MGRTLFFCMVLRKFSEITNKPDFSQYNIFYNYEYFFFQSAFWSLFNHRQRSQSNQEQCSMCCSSPCFRVLLCTHYGPLQCFSTYFRKLKEIGVLQPIFPDYVISCDYVVGHKPRSLKLSSLEPTPWQRSFYHLPYQYLSLISISLSTNLLLLLKFVLF